ncbi:MAG: hypothetical protein GY927_06810 [bacterium]|nr:hypothetical protein [bacterium]
MHQLLYISLKGLDPKAGDARAERSRGMRLSKLYQQLHVNKRYPQQVIENALGGCPRIEAVARESRFESDFSII